MGKHSTRCINSKKSVKQSILEAFKGTFYMIAIVLLLIATIVAVPLFMLGSYLFDKFRNVRSL